MINLIFKIHYSRQKINTLKVGNFISIIIKCDFVFVRYRYFEFHKNNHGINDEYDKRRACEPGRKILIPVTVAPQYSNSHHYGCYQCMAM